MPLFLETCGSKDSGETVEVHGTQFLIGRRDTCQIKYNDTTISAQHVKLLFEDDTWYLQDLSSNGTFVNDELVGKGKRVALQDNDSISLLKPTDAPEPPSYAYVVSLNEDSKSEPPEPESEMGDEREVEEPLPLAFGKKGRSRRTEAVADERKEEEPLPMAAGKKGRSRRKADVELDELDDDDEPTRRPRSSKSRGSALNNGDDTDAKPALSSEQAINLAMAQLPEPDAGAFGLRSSAKGKLGMDLEDDDEGDRVGVPRPALPQPDDDDDVPPAAPSKPEASKELKGKGLSEESFLAAVQQAVDDANKQAEIVRLQAVETAAQAVAEHWKKVSEEQLAQLVTQKDAERREAVQATIAALTEEQQNHVNAAVGKALEKAARAADDDKNAAVAEASERVNAAALAEAEAKATQRLVAALTAAREQAASEAAVMLEAKDREAQANRIACAKDAEVEIRRKVDLALEAARVESAVDRQAAVDAAVREEKERYDRQLKHAAEASDRALKLAMVQAEEATGREVARTAAEVREECAKEASVRELEASREARKAQDEAVAAALEAAAEREKEKLRLALEDHKVGHQQAVAEAVASAQEQSAKRHEEDIQALSAGDEEATKRAIGAAVDAAVERVRREAEADLLRRVAEAKAEARAEVTERVMSEMEFAMEDACAKAAANAAATATEQSNAEREAAVKEVVREYTQREATIRVQATKDASKLVEHELASAAAAAKLHASQEAAVGQEEALTRQRIHLSGQFEKDKRAAVEEAVAAVVAEHEAKEAELLKHAATAAAIELERSLEEKRARDERAPDSARELTTLLDEAKAQARDEAAAAHAEAVEQLKVLHDVELKTKLAEAIAETEAETFARVKQAEAARKLDEQHSLHAAAPSDLGAILENAKREATFVAEALAEEKVGQALREAASSKAGLLEARQATAVAQLEAKKWKEAFESGTSPEAAEAHKDSTARLEAEYEARCLDLRGQLDATVAERDELRRLTGIQHSHEAQGVVSLKRLASPYDDPPEDPAVKAADASGLVMVMVQTGVESVTVEWMVRPPEDGGEAALKPSMYELQWRAEALDGSGPPVAQWSASEGSKALKVSSATKRNLSADSLYRFRVRAKDADGQWQPFTLPSTAIRPKSKTTNDDMDD